MASYTFTPRGVCSRKIDFTLENGIIKDVRFTGGCSGNTQGVAALCIGRPADEVVKIIKGIRCGVKPHLLSRPACKRAGTGNRSGKTGVTPPLKNPCGFLSEDSRRDFLFWLFGIRRAETAHHQFHPVGFGQRQSGIVLDRPVSKRHFCLPAGTVPPFLPVKGQRNDRPVFPRSAAQYLRLQ